MSPQVATTAISCNAKTVNATVTFLDNAGRTLGLNLATLGADAFQSVVADPLTAQYGLTLMMMVSHRLSNAVPFVSIVSSPAAVALIGSNGSENGK